MKVYCDTGAYSHDLRDMERLGEIKVFQFKYENKNKRIKNIATPSQPTWEQPKYSWSELGGLTWADAGRRSKKWPEITTLIGASNKTDAQHLDSAFMSECEAFLTSDKGDIVAHAEKLQTMLGMKVFHVPNQWADFVVYVRAKN